MNIRIIPSFRSRRISLSQGASNFISQPEANAIHHEIRRVSKLCFGRVPFNSFQQFQTAARGRGYGADDVQTIFGNLYATRTNIFSKYGVPWGFRPTAWALGKRILLGEWFNLFADIGTIGRAKNKAFKEYAWFVSDTLFQLTDMVQEFDGLPNINQANDRINRLAIFIEAESKKV